jgi:2-octaprenylphenol hydroxylase
MEVWDKDSFGRIAFDDQSMGYSHLGHIIENSVIHQALWNKAHQCSDVSILAPAELQQVAWGENEAFLTLKDGNMLPPGWSSVLMAPTHGYATKPIFR